MIAVVWSSKHFRRSITRHCTTSATPPFHPHRLTCLKMESRQREHRLVPWARKSHTRLFLVNAFCEKVRLPPRNVGSLRFGHPLNLLEHETIEHFVHEGLKEGVNGASESPMNFTAIVRLISVLIDQVIESSATQRALGFTSFYPSRKGAPRIPSSYVRFKISSMLDSRSSQSSKQTYLRFPWRFQYSY